LTQKAAAHAARSQGEKKGNSGENLPFIMRFSREKVKKERASLRSSLQSGSRERKKVTKKEVQHGNRRRAVECGPAVQTETF